METATAESFSSNQNGAANYRPINFDHAEDDDDDFGPETNVDNIDDGLMSQSVTAKKSYFNSDTIKTSYDQLQNDVLDGKIGEGLEKGAKETEIEILDNGKAVLSDESDDEEWNYFKGDTNNKADSQKLENSGDVSSNEMDYTLNPDAQEFVPVSPKSDRNSSQSPEICLYSLKNKDKLLNDDFVASSPLKGQEKSMDNVVVPSLDDFEKEIKKRPSNIMPKFDSDEFNVDNYEMNNGDALLESPFENTNSNDTYASTRAVFGDDSTFAANLEEVNQDLNEKEDDEKEFAEKKETEEITSTTDNDNGSEGAFENEDYPSIVEKEDNTNSILSSSNITYNRDSGNYEVEKEVPKFEQLLQNNDNTSVFDCLSHINDSTDNVIQSMSSFDDGAPMQSLLITSNDSALLSNGNKSPIDDHFGVNSNPFASGAIAEEREKEIAEEKEVKLEESRSDLSGFDPFGANEVDFKCELDRSPFDDASAPQLDTLKDIVEEPVVAEEVRDVEVIPGKVEEESKPAVVDDIVSQILDNDEYELQKSEAEEHFEKPEHKEHFEKPEYDVEHESHDSGVDEIKENESPSASVEEPIRSVDMETPFIHECSRLNEKPDSVHQEPTERKHYEDLLPDYEKTATMESDKLESELRETKKELDDGHDDFHFDAQPAPAEEQFQSLVCPRGNSNFQELAEEPKNEALVELPVPEVSSDAEIKVAETDDTVVSSTPVLNDQPEAIVEVKEEENVAVTAAAVGAVAAVTAGVAGVAAVQEKKRASIVSKKPDEKAKPPGKPLAKSPATTLKARTSTTSSLKANTAPKKPATTMLTKTPPVKAAAPPRPITKPTTLSAKTMAAKPALPKTTASKPLTKPASPLKPKTTLSSTATSPRPTTKPLSNGDVTSTTKTAPRKPLPKKTTSSISSTTPAPSKPAVNLATRVSLAPKKPLTKTESAEKPRTSLGSKRPISAPSKITKDSKDITNKQLSTKVPPKSNTLKTESKVNSGLKRTTAKEVAEQNANQSDKNMNGNA